MTSRKHHVVLFSLLFAACLIGLLLVMGRHGFFVSPYSSASAPDAAARQREWAMKDLQETRDQIAKMKAHGIGMPESSSMGPVKDAAAR